MLRFSSNKARPSAQPGGSSILRIATCVPWAAAERYNAPATATNGKIKISESGRARSAGSTRRGHENKLARPRNDETRAKENGLPEGGYEAKGVRAFVPGVHGKITRARPPPGSGFGLAFKGNSKKWRCERSSPRWLVAEGSIRGRRRRKCRAAPAAGWRPQSRKSDGLLVVAANGFPAR